MRIAQVAPLWESVPPKRYGGTERVVSYLTEELVRLGHDVTLFASGDSETQAELVATCPESLRLNENLLNSDAPMVLHYQRAFASGRDFDLIHNHLDFHAFPLARLYSAPVVTTVHGRRDLPELMPLFREFRDQPLISISDAQRQPMPWANWIGTVYHGLPRDLYQFQPRQGSYLAFLGRMAPEKRPDHAIRVAQATGIPLRMAAKVDRANREYFERVIEPMLDDPLIEFIGEIHDGEKNDFLGDALALIAPFDWPEPFGLVLIEALACGTPVLAYRRGSIPEIIEEGVTGFVCEGVADMAEMVTQVSGLDRRLCRESFEERFTVDRMAQEYVLLYEALLESRAESSLYAVNSAP